MAENINISFVPDKRKSIESRLVDVEDYIGLLTDRVSYCLLNSSDSQPCDDYAMKVALLGISSSVGRFKNEAKTAEIFNDYTGNAATGDYSHAEGRKTEASGAISHAEGESTKAAGGYSHAEGQFSKAVGSASHAEGFGTKASADYSHAEGGNTEASGNYAHAEGYSSVASGLYSHAEGFDTEAVGTYGAHAEGYLTKAEGLASHAEGMQSAALGAQGAHAEGFNTSASALSAHSEGGNTKARGNYSHSEGSNTEAVGNYSHAEGQDTKATGEHSHAEGKSTVASGPYSHTEGGYTEAVDYSHAEGINSKATGIASHAEGDGTLASGNYSHAQNSGTVAAAKCSTAMGSYNKYEEDGKTLDLLLAVGNGTSDSKRSNALELYTDGSLKIAGDFSAENVLDKNDLADWAKQPQKPAYKADEVGAADKTEAERHYSNTDNPHSVTAAQLGLSNVDNTADMDKPVSSLQQAAIDKAVSGVEIGGRNYLSNSAFLQGKGVWRLDSGCTVDTETLYNGHPTIKIDASGYTTNAYIGAQNDYTPTFRSFSLNAGETAVLSFYYYVPTLDGFDSYLRNNFCGAKEGNDALIALETTTVLLEDIVVGKWAKFEAVITAGVNYSKCYNNTFISRNGKIWFADFKLEKGNKATDWTPAPEDSETRIVSLEERVTALETALIALGGEL